MEALFVLLQYSKRQHCWCRQGAVSESIARVVEVLLWVTLLVLPRYCRWKQCWCCRGTARGVVEALKVMVLLLLLGAALLQGTMSLLSE